MLAQNRNASQTRKRSQIINHLLNILIYTSAQKHLASAQSLIFFFLSRRKSSLCGGGVHQPISMHHLPFVVDKIQTKYLVATLCASAWPTMICLGKKGGKKCGINIQYLKSVYISRKEIRFWDCNTPSN